MALVGDNPMIKELQKLIDWRDANHPISDTYDFDTPATIDRAKFLAQAYMTIWHEVIKKTEEING